MEDDNKVERVEEKHKSLIDRFWWIIPPVFITFVYWPLFWGVTSYSAWLLGRSWYEALLKSILSHFSVLYFSKIQNLFSFENFGWIIPFFTFGSIGIGFIITKKMSVKYKILIPSILGAIWSPIGFFVYYMIRWNIT